MSNSASSNMVDSMTAITSSQTKDNTNLNYDFKSSTSSAAKQQQEQEEFSYGIEVAFALNNMAIAMMEQGCIAQSCETFQSAVVAIRSVVSNGENDDNDDICKRLQAAVHNAMHPHRTRLPAFAPSVTFRVVSSHWETSFLSSSSTSTTSTNEFRYTLIRMDDDDQPNNRCLHHSISADTAVLLYNFAVASFVYFTYDSFNTPHRYNRLIESIGLLFHSIQHLENEERKNRSSATHNHSDKVVSSFSSSIFFFSRILFFLGTALQTLHSCLLALGQRDQAFACLERLIQIRTMFCVWNECTQVNHHLTKENAAAA